MKPTKDNGFDENKIKMARHDFVKSHLLPLLKSLELGIADAQYHRCD